MTPPFRILIAHPSADRYGADAVLMRVVSALSNDYDVHVCLPTSGPLSESLDELGHPVDLQAFPVIRRSDLRPREVPRFLLRSVIAIFALTRYIRRNSYDVIYVNTVTLPVWLVAARLARIPAVCHVHESDMRIPYLQRLLLTRPLRLAARVIVVSSAAGDFASTGGPKVAQRISKVLNGVPLEEHDLECRDVPNGPVLVVGRLGPNKGQDLAIRALGLLHSLPARPTHLRGPTLWLAGDAYPGYEWFQASLRRQSRECGVDHLVKFLGYVEDTADLYSQAAVVLVPSRTDSLPLVPLGAMAASCPVIATAVGGIPEIVRHRETGLLVPPEDELAMAAALMEVLADPKYAAALGRAGHARLRREFSLDRFNAAVLYELAQVLPKASSVAGRSDVSSDEGG